MIYGDAQGFKVPFLNFWYIDGWDSVPDPIRKIGCILENLGKKAPNLYQIRYSDGSQNHFSKYRDSRNSEVYFEHSRTNCFEDDPTGLRYWGNSFLQSLETRNKVFSVILTCKFSRDIEVILSCTAPVQRLFFSIQTLHEIHKGNSFIQSLSGKCIFQFYFQLQNYYFMTVDKKVSLKSFSAKVFCSVIFSNKLLCYFGNSFPQTTSAMAPGQQLILGVNS